MHTFNNIIFDFNGTLFWDTPLHNRAWDIFLKKHGILITDEEKNSKIHGKTNKDILTDLFKRPLTDADIREYSHEKEKYYQEICAASNPKLAPGAASLLDKLKANNISFTVATASGTENIHFYFEILNLGRWFSIDGISYNDSDVPGKPDPELFLRAYRLLNASPVETIIFEDSHSGILAAEISHAGKIIIVDSGNDDYSAWKYEKINTFDGIELNNLLELKGL